MNATSGDGNDHPDNNLPNHFENERRKGTGRRKVKMEKMENESNLQVTFSKRRAGIFKKASELSTLCGAELALLIFSPVNNPHCFGHPNFEEIATRFLQGIGRRVAPPAGVNASEAVADQRNQELVGMEERLEQERQRRREIDGQELAVQLENLSLEQLQHVWNLVMTFHRLITNAASSASVGGAFGHGTTAGTFGHGTAAGGYGQGTAVGAYGQGTAAGAYDYGTAVGAYGQGTAAGGYGYSMAAGGVAPGNGNTMQYQLSGNYGMGSNNYGDPSAVVADDAGNGSSDMDEDEDEDEDEDGPTDGANDGGFPGHYGHPGGY